MLIYIFSPKAEYSYFRKMSISRAYLNDCFKVLFPEGGPGACSGCEDQLWAEARFCVVTERIGSHQSFDGFILYSFSSHIVSFQNHSSFFLKFKTFCSFYNPSFCTKCFAPQNLRFRHKLIFHTFRRFAGSHVRRFRT